MTKPRPAGHLLIDCLLAQGVDTAFGVPGESYLPVIDALYDARNRLRLIVSRHEGGAAFMAEAYGKLTGQPGICFVTRGPGATNAAIGVHTARQNSTPLILFVGQVGRHMREREAFQEIDYRAFFGSLAKWVTEIDDAARIPEIVARAFATALSGRPGPVVVALPEDMLREMTSATAVPATAHFEAEPSAGALRAAIALLKRAQRPLVIVGGGGWTSEGRRALDAFAAANRLPVAVAFRFHDLVDNASACYIGDAGVGMAPYLKETIRQADLVLGVNLRFGESTTDGWRVMRVPNPEQTLIHAHASDAEIGRIYQPDLAVHAGPNRLMSALAAAGTLGDWGDWRDRGRAGLEAMRASASQSGALDMVRVCQWLDANLDEDAIVTNGAGNFAIWPSKFLTFSGGRRLLAPQSGAMGAGLPAAIAAKAVHSGRQVVCFAGDGDFQMVLAEMGTAAQESLQPIILLFNNGMYGTIRAHQEQRFPGRVMATSLKNPDFVALARAYGFWAERVGETRDFTAAFRAAARSSTGALIELMIDKDDITPFARLEAMRRGET